MVKFIRIFVIFLYFVTQSSAVFAFSDNVYDVANIKVNTTGKDGLDAKQKALAIAEGKAVDILFGRLLTPRQKKTALNNLDKGTRALLVKGFSVRNEQSGGAQYIAEITIKFRKIAVQEYLNQIGAQYSDIQADSSLLIPILTDASGNTVIWSAQNPWSAALSANDLRNSLIPLKIPNSSEAGLLATEQEIIDKNPNAIYQLSSVASEGAEPVFAHMTLSANAATLRVTGLITFTRKYTIENNDLNAVYQKASQDFLTTLVSDWRNDNISSKPQLATIQVLVVFSDFNQWMGIRRRLLQISAVSEFDTAAMTAEGTFIDLKYTGSITAMADEMQLNGLTLIDLGGYFEIRG